MKTTAFLALAFLLAPALATADCPSSCIAGASPNCSTDPVRFVVLGPSPGAGPANGGYDLPAGTLQAQGLSSGGFTGGGIVDASDRYHVIGVAAGTPLTFSAELQVTCDAVGGAGFYAGLLEGASNLQSFTTSNPGLPTFTTQSVVLVTIHRLAGEEFDMTMTVRGFGGPSGKATITGAWKFKGLPPGAQVVSCNGYLQDFPVAALPGSWGSLKARYR
jgi:hypothetical protein